MTIRRPRSAAGPTPPGGGQPKPKTPQERTPVDDARATLTGTPVGQRLDDTAAELRDRLTALDAVRIQLQAELRQVDRLRVSIARLTPQQIASIPPDTPIEWLESFATSQA